MHTITVHRWPSCSSKSLNSILLCFTHCVLLTVSCGRAGLGGLIMAAACMMWMWTLWRQLSSTQKQLASEIQRLHNMQVTKFHHTCMPGSVKPYMYTFPFWVPFQMRLGTQCAKCSTHNVCHSSTHVHLAVLFWLHLEDGGAGMYCNVSFL